jgi:hypothetical protein
MSLVSIDDIMLGHPVYGRCASCHSAALRPSVGERRPIGALLITQSRLRRPRCRRRGRLRRLIRTKQTRSRQTCRPARRE